MRSRVARSHGLVQRVEALIYLDTHVIVWLYASGKETVPKLALDRIREDEVKISPMVRLELQYLYEIGRVSTPAAVVFDELAAAIGLSICSQSFPAIVSESEKQSWTRDPFDRIIVAHAALSGSTLITKDETIHRHYPHACWDQLD